MSQMTLYADGGDDFVADPKALPVSTLEGWLRDIRFQPGWRWEANIESDYYDGNQLDSTTLAEMAERGIAPLITNLIAPTIDVVLGMEAKSRTDWKVAPDTDQDTDTAEAMNVKLHEAERVSRADRGISEAYASQIKVGIGWVEVSRETDPFKSPYRVKAVHRREIWWDWMAKEIDLSDARYMIRKRWVDQDLAMAFFPDFKDLIENVISGWPLHDWDMTEGNSTGLSRWLFNEYGVEQNATMEEMEWLDSERKRVCLHEVWYKIYEQGFILRLPDGFVVEYNPEDQDHVMAVAAGLVTPRPVTLTRVRLSWWIGPHRLVDIPSPYPHNSFPYIPFIGKREDRTNVPYGLIRAMRSPQDEVNARKSKMMWLLSAKRLVGDSDALTSEDWDSAAEEAARPDAVFILRADRQNKGADAFRIEDDMDLNRQQHEALKEAKKEIQDTPGVYQEMMGRNTREMSGIAINSLVEQGTMTLAEINDNFRYSRIQVGELLLSLVKEDIGKLQTKVILGKGTSNERNITLNEMVFDDEGGRNINNNLVRTRMTVELEEVPSTPTYRQQQLVQLTELTKSLPPEFQAAVADMVIEASDYPQRHKMAERIRDVNGQNKNPENMNQEELDQYNARMAEEAKLKEHNDAMMAAQLAEAEAKARKANAEADFAIEKGSKTRAETDKIELDSDMAPAIAAMDNAVKAKSLQEPIEKPAEKTAAKKSKAK